MPDSVRAVIERRLATLSADCRSVLETAAVIGREFRRDILAGAVAADGDARCVDAAIGEALRAGILVEGDDAGRARFAHALICETLAASLTAPETQPPPSPDRRGDRVPARCG